jgi:hypothetical protein
MAFKRCPKGHATGNGPCKICARQAMPKSAGAASAPLDVPAAPPSHPTARPAPNVVDEQSRAQMHLMAAALAGAVCALLIHDAELRPAESELDAILEPLERVVLRRVSIAGKFSEDAQDLTLFVIGVVAYGLRIQSIVASRPKRAVPATRQQSGQRAAPPNPQAPVDGNGHLPTPLFGLGPNQDALAHLPPIAPPSGP